MISYHKKFPPDFDVDNIVNITEARVKAISCGHGAASGGRNDRGGRNTRRKEPQIHTGKHGSKQSILFKNENIGVNPCPSAVRQHYKIFVGRY